MPTQAADLQVLFLTASLNPIITFKYLCGARPTMISRYVGRTARTYQELIRKSNQAMVEDGWRKVILICILVPGGIEALYCVVHISVDLNR